MGPSLLTTLLLTATTAFAHDPGMSNATIELGGDRIVIAMHIVLTDLAALGEPDLQAVAARAVEWRTASGKAPVRVLAAKASDATSADFTFDVPRVAGEFHSLLLPELPMGHRQVLVIRDFTGDSYRIQMLSAKTDQETITAADLVKTAPPVIPTPRYVIWLGYLGPFALLGVLMCRQWLTPFHPRS